MTSHFEMLHPLIFIVSTVASLFLLKWHWLRNIVIADNNGVSPKPYVCKLDFANELP